MTNQVLHKRTIAIPGPRGDVTKEAVDAVAAAQTAASTASSSATTAVAARDRAVQAADEASGAPATDANIANIVETGPLAAGALDFAFADRMHASGTSSPHFALMGEAVRDKDAECKVVVLGTTTANGGNAPFAEQGFSRRLAYRLGAKVYELDTADNFNPGVRWYHGAQAARRASNYVPAARMAKIRQVKPAYVLHMVGADDWTQETDPQTYRSQVAAQVALIQTASPTAIQVLIHQQARHDYASRRYDWSAYADALRAIAATDPTHLVFVDLNRWMRGLNTYGVANRWGLVDTDKANLRAQGQLVIADILGSIMGIPSESQFAGTEDVEWMTFGASATYSNAGVASTLSSLYVRPASYPRLARIHGTALVKANGGYADFIFDYSGRVQDNTPKIRESSSTDVSATLTGMELYIPPDTSGTITLSIMPMVGSVFVNGNPNYTNASVSFVRI